MKKIVFFILAAALPLLGCAGGDCAEFVGEKDGGLAVSFGTAAPTRAFFDGDPAGEPWEREIRTLEAIICDGEGNVLHRRLLNRTEIDTGKALFPETDLPTVGDCTIYLLANYDTSGISEGFEFLTDTPVSKYNGSYEQLRQGCADPGGFAMAAVGTLTFVHTYQNPLHLTLRRTVSKLELKITVGDDLSVYHPNGELEVTETVINSIAQNISLFASTTTGETSLSQPPFEQEQSREYRNVFYLFAHETLIPEITLHAKFYPDGKAANPANFTEHSFNFSPEGGIAPNTYYRLNANIINLDEIIIPYEITFGRVSELNYLQYNKIYECEFAITPWPVEGASFTIRAERMQGDLNYLDVFYDGINILGNEVSVTPSVTGNFTVTIRYSPPFIYYINDVVKIFYTVKDNLGHSILFIDNWIGKNALEVVTRWQGESLNCSLLVGYADYEYSTDEGQNSWTTFLFGQTGFWLIPNPDPGYRFDGWYLDSDFTQLYKPNQNFQYLPSESEFRLFPKVIKDDV